MGSIIPGYNYDVFISYRQKDNKGERWVSEFVDSLKNELESTFKETISVYFDINPTDGLLETHDVDASLNEKLHCLVFIPIISRTYCDPKSFAWEREFMAFLEQASRDQFGLKIKLLNGNFESRVLPVRIHDLSSTDLRLCEDILDGELRAIDFTYKSPGVNRPLRGVEDHPHDNLNKIFYRDQINKVANAIDEIISSLRSTHNQVNTANWSFRDNGNQNNDVFNDDDIKITGGIKLKTRGIISKKNRGGIYKLVKYRNKNIYKWIATILFITAIVLFALGRKGQLNFLNPGKAKRELAKSHVRQAVTYINNKDYDAAKAELDLALSSDPKYSYAWSSLAALSVKQGNLNKAIAESIKAVDLDPTNSEAAYNMAYTLDDKKDYHQAIKWYKTAIRIDSTLKKDSTLVPAYSALGRVYNNINQPIDAILILNKVREQYSGSKYIYLVYKNLGNAYLLQEQTDSALKYLRLSRGINPIESETAMFLAKAYEASGQMSRSIEIWQDYIDLEKDSIKINEAKRHLKEITIRHLQEIIK